MRDPIIQIIEGYAAYKTASRNKVEAAREEYATLKSELAAAREEIARLKAQPKRVVDAEKLKEVFISADDKIIDEYANGKSHRCYLSRVEVLALIESLAIPAPDYMGALRTLAIHEIKHHYSSDNAIIPEAAITKIIDYALANPTKEGS